MKIQELIEILNNYPNKEDQVFISLIPAGRDHEVTKEIGGLYRTVNKSDFSIGAVVISEITPTYPLKA